MRCKVCGANDPVSVGAIDFSKTCEDHKAGPIFPACGRVVAYHRCAACGFLFTSDFDEWGIEDFRREIYNADYALADPDAEKHRPISNADGMAPQWQHLKGARILDYGGGSGRFAARMREHGFSVETYDPIVPEHAKYPSGSFDVVTSFETIEHVPDPRRTAGEIAGLCNGFVLLTTLLQPEPYGDTSWWYCAPRNGHISMHSASSLATLWGLFGFVVHSLNSGAHVLTRAAAGFQPEG